MRRREEGLMTLPQVRMLLRERRTVVRAVLCFLLFILNSDYMASAAECELPSSWRGLWFHSGFPDPVTIDEKRISVKGECVHQDTQHKNMFLIRVSESGYGSCYQCMMIYDKHFNVLQYKESYCEENIESMESLCNTIPGDAPLYTMFRKDGELVKCPFRGPFSFSYSKGARGQVCEYPSSYMDTCTDNRRMQFRYQACLDVEGSEVASEELSCLASWKEGSSRYLVAVVNSTHAHNDESRYRCFLYQHQRSSSGEFGGGGGNDFKMAQSDKASCVGLWSVDEGVKTFKIKKIDTEEESQCHFPSWLSRHHNWRTLENGATLHVNKNTHSLKLSNRTVESHISCHKNEEVRPGVARLVAHVKSGCDSGFVCMVFYSRDEHVIQMRYGAHSRHPNEACMNYYFDERSSPLTTLVSTGGGGHNNHNTRPCPFSGRYSLTGPRSAMMSLLQQQQQQCQTPISSTVMHAGCSAASSDLKIESSACPVIDSFTCHGKWTEEADEEDEVEVKSLLLRSPLERHLLLLSTAGKEEEEDNSLSSRRHFVCLSYTERDGVLLATAARSCGDHNNNRRKKQKRGSGDDDDERLFNITSSGPCLQALTGGGAAAQSPHFANAVLALAATTMLKCCDPFWKSGV